LGIVALTVGILRVETASELDILTAAGATSTIRRTLTAPTSASLALAGASLGTLAAYAGLIAG
jgi:putative ABC transport system permease protein